MLALSYPAMAKRPPPRSLRPRSPRPKSRSATGRALPLEIDPSQVEETLSRVKGELRHWANKGRYTKVRFKFRGKQLLPDIPLAAVVAAQGLTFYWGGILRALIVNLAGNTVLDIELVNDSERRLQKGKEELLSGEVERGLRCFEEALAMDRDNPRVHLNLGVAYKLKGELASARASLEKAKSLDPEGAAGAEAERLLAGLAAPKTAGQGAP